MNHASAAGGGRLKNRPAHVDCWPCAIALGPQYSYSLIMKTTTKKAAKATQKTISAKMAELQAAWTSRGVAEGECEQMAALRNEMWALEAKADGIVVSDLLVR